MVRIRTKWNKNKPARNFGDTASGLCVSIWRMACECVLNLENEGFETDTNAQRLDIIAEFSVFAIHLLDRFAYAHLDTQSRAGLITATARRFAEIMQDNRIDTDGGGRHEEAFIALLNRRADEYAECSCGECGEPGFSMRRVLGEHVRDLMGEKHRQWVPDYVIDKEAPDLYRSLRRAGQLVFA